MSLSTAQGIGLRETSTNPPRQRSPQYSFTANPPTFAAATNAARTDSSNQPTTTPSIATSSAPTPAPSSTKTSTKFTSKPSPPGTLSNLKKRSQRWINDWITDWWGLELLSWAISAASLLAIFVLLQSHRGRPLPEWPFSLTVNSLVSIFATIAQMAMMKPVVECISQLKWLWFIRKSRRLAEFQNFDDASRGPTGSLFLLGKLSGIHLVSLGAAISVISIAFGPVSQQVVTFPLHLHAVANASVPQASMFLNTENNLTLVFSPPLLEGISGSPQTLSDVIPSCSTGNCTWDTYSSLGICTTTIDISSTVTNNTCNTTAFDEIFEGTGVSSLGYHCFNYSLPVHATSLMPSPQAGSFGTGVVYNNATLTDAQPDEGHGSGNLQVLTLSTGIYDDYSLIDTNLLYQPGTLVASNGSTLPPPIALRSSLQLCVQTYETTVSDSNTTTEMVSSQPLNGTLIRQSDGNTTFAVNGSTFVVSFDAFALFEAFLTTALADFCEVRINSTLETAVGLNGTCGSDIGAALMDKIQTLNDMLSTINNIMENVAIGITNNIRQGAGGNIHINQFQGTAYLPVTYVETDYIWFTLPVGLVLLTLIFLVATIIKSHRLGTKNWKSSNFPTLQGLHPNVQDHLGGLESLSVMEEKVDETVVRLRDAKENERRNGIGWRLVKAN